jgi:aminodeoxyfutalosine synthase
MTNEERKMTMTTHALEDLERKVDAAGLLTPAELARVLACPDLVSVGVLGEMARRRASGDVVTFGRVAVVAPGPLPADAGSAGELRVLGAPGTRAEAVARARAAADVPGRPTLTAFSLADLLDSSGHDHLVLADLAAELRAAGVDAVAEVPVDRFVSTEALIDALRAIGQGGLAAPRATVDRAGLGDRLALIERVAEAHAETGALRAFAPLPRVDPIETPSTGYDDVKTIALARLRCPASVVIQVDWPLYGPKLAQVALAYGAGDVDGVAAVDVANLGARRSPVEDISRQIRAAGGTPVERDGRFERRG